MNRALKFHKMILSKELVKGFSARDKKRLLMLMNMLRDMALFRKLMLYVKPPAPIRHGEFDQAEHVTLGFSFNKLLISKAFEIWQFLDKEKIEEESKFSPALQEYWNKVKIFFSSEKNRELFNFVRNKFGFHFDHYQDIEPYIEAAIDEVGDMKFWMGEDSASNDIFESANSIMLIVLCSKMRELGFQGSEEELIGQIQRLPIDISHALNEFCQKYLTEVLLKDKAFQQTEEIVVNVPLLSEVSLPLIVKNDTKEKRTVPK
jgi:hypothetical protein